MYPSLHVYEATGSVELIVVFVHVGFTVCDPVGLNPEGHDHVVSDSLVAVSVLVHLVEVPDPDLVYPESHEYDASDDEHATAQ